ncbi:f-box domain containing protein [Rutstroemia sp. NJR-2017a BBW]|nr:f-box domain containing protein [Rutstroemia sp. NJR-2017a BBW]
MAENYILRVTAGSDYDVSKHQVVPVNQPQATKIDNDLCTVDLNDYRGLPRSSPSTSPYFSRPPHDRNQDQYSISFRFAPKQDINADDLVFGNDFDHPIRDRLPPGFSTAFRIVKWVVDPGLDGDVYADKPYLYGPAASSLNVIWVEANGEGKEKEEEVKDEEGEKEGSGAEETEDAGLVFEEGGDEEGLEHRREYGIPDGEAARKKFFLTQANRKEWDWEAGKSYGCDFFNAYLDFNTSRFFHSFLIALDDLSNLGFLDFALKLPGFSMPIMKYWDGQGLRAEALTYAQIRDEKPEDGRGALRGAVYAEDVDEEGNLKEGVEGGKPFDLLEEGEGEKHLKEKNGEEEGVEGEKKEVKTDDDSGVD